MKKDGLYHAEVGDEFCNNGEPYYAYPQDTAKKVCRGCCWCKESYGDMCCTAPRGFPMCSKGKVVFARKVEHEGSLNI